MITSDAVPVEIQCILRSIYGTLAVLYMGSSNNFMPKPYYISDLYRSLITCTFYLFSDDFSALCSFGALILHFLYGLGKETELFLFLELCAFKTRQTKRQRLEMSEILLTDHISTQLTNCHRIYLLSLA